MHFYFRNSVIDRSFSLVREQDSARVSTTSTTLARIGRIGGDPPVRKLSVPILTATKSCFEAMAATATLRTATRPKKIQDAAWNVYKSSDQSQRWPINHPL